MQIKVHLTIEPNLTPTTSRTYMLKTCKLPRLKLLKTHKYSTLKRVVAQKVTIL